MSQLSLDLGGPPAGDVPPDSAAGDWVPPDQPERDRIVGELDANLLVEAGAGSGKTTSMVGRMVAMVRAGREADRIAAVTFTRKAAGELRERFQEALEAAYRDAMAGGDDAARARFGAALDAIDRCFLGTIHAFCARLLRERPLEAGIAPDFEEMTQADEDRLRAESWTRFLERLMARDRSRLLAALADHGLRPAQLRDAFRDVADNPDVRFRAPKAPEPDRDRLAAVRRELESLVIESERLLPDEEPERGPDPLQAKVRRLAFLRRFVSWDRDLAFLAALEEAVQRSSAVTQNRWGDDKATKAAAKTLGLRWERFAEEGGAAHGLLEHWWARRYRVAIRFLRAAAGSYERDRHRLGLLTFQDLLVRTAAMLRSDPVARADLGDRYRWLLVDEFQDTDPVQAEILMLLASDAAAGDDWRAVVPRPGALFVVGDPKQSIYRFRRADIAVYNQVKRRFASFGEVLHLVTNFRSTPPIERLVNRVFEPRFPASETEHQAAFAPLRVRPAGTGAQGGVRWYSFPLAGGGSHRSGRRVSDPEAPRLASWIRARIDAGERRPGDFMVLTTRKAQLAAYAQALEAQGVPVQVSGAGVGAEAELQELLRLLQALADPDDGVLTLAVLEGLFFGLSHRDLYDHVAAGGRLSFLGDPAGAPPGPVTDALAVMRRFWQDARRLPADVAIARMAERLGLLPWAAAGDLGPTRAGAVVYALDALRVGARDGAASLPEAIEILDAALQQEVDAPLVPGGADAVRVMNLHKAKGLEAPVVVLAYPAVHTDHAVTRHIARDDAGEPIGWLRITDPDQRGDRTLARPADWAAHEQAERPYDEAEELRRLYVAATRAGEELVVARCADTDPDGCWALLHPALDDPALAARIEIEPVPAPERERLAEDQAAVLARVEAVAGGRARLAGASRRERSVTARVHGTGPGAAAPAAAPDDGDNDPARPATEILPLTGPEFRDPDGPAPEPRGQDWGSAVHRALEAALRDDDPSAASAAAALRSLCRSALLEFDRPVDPATGEPAELAELVALVEAMRRHDVWNRVRAARRVLVEAPFAFAVSAADAQSLGIAEPAAQEILEGVIDLAIQDDAGRWTIVDFKTDARPDAAREAAYRRQLRLYAEAFVRVAGDPAVPAGG